eukprot:366379-Chlamydomonas_euryale.AAC.8
MLDHDNKSIIIKCQCTLVTDARRHTDGTSSLRHGFGAHAHGFYVHVHRLGSPAVVPGAPALNLSGRTCTRRQRGKAMHPHGAVPDLSPKAKRQSSAPARKEAKQRTRTMQRCNAHATAMPLDAPPSRLDGLLTV